MPRPNALHNAYNIHHDENNMLWFLSITMKYNIVYGERPLSIELLFEYLYIFIYLV